MENKKIIMLSILAIFLSVFSIWFSFSNKNDVRWEIVQNEGGEVDVFLKGSSASKVSGADIKLFLSLNNVKVTAVKPGGFFVSPIVVQMDNKNLVYSLFSNPENKTPNDLTKPVVRISLAPAKLAGNKFYTLPGSQVYLRNIGGVFPRVSQITLK